MTARRIAIVLAIRSPYCFRSSRSELKTLASLRVLKKMSKRSSFSYL